MWEPKIALETKLPVLWKETKSYFSPIELYKILGIPFGEDNVFK